MEEIVTKINQRDSASIQSMKFESKVLEFYNKAAIRADQELNDREQSDSFQSEENKENSFKEKSQGNITFLILLLIQYDF